jgi:hypothetical protein
MTEPHHYESDWRAMRNQLRSERVWRVFCIWGSPLWFGLGLYLGIQIWSRHL